MKDQKIHRGDAEQKNAESAEKNMDESKIEFMKMEFGKLELKPGDILVLKYQGHLPVSGKEIILKELGNILPRGMKVMFLEDDTQIGVLSVQE